MSRADPVYDIYKYNVGQITSTLVQHYVGLNVRQMFCVYWVSIPKNCSAVSDYVTWTEGSVTNSNTSKNYNYNVTWLIV